ncbi:MAG TPA: hypothetical protein VGL77_13960, partial [Armatimonadota bacterium]
MSMTWQLRVSILSALLCGLLASIATAQLAPSAFRLTRDTLRYDAGSIQYAPADWKDPGKGALSASGWVQYTFAVPATGWYGVYFKEMPPLAREVFVDGKRVSLGIGLSAKMGAELLGLQLDKVTPQEFVKEANVSLTAGTHTLRIDRVGRMGFPAGLPRAWEIRAAGGEAHDRLSARVDGFNVLRVGEKLKLALTGGG